MRKRIIAAECPARDRYPSRGASRHGVIDGSGRAAAVCHIEHQHSARQRATAGAR